MFASYVRPRWLCLFCGLLQAFRGIPATLRQDTLPLCRMQTWTRSSFHSYIRAPYYSIPILDKSYDLSVISYFCRQKATYLFGRWHDPRENEILAGALPHAKASRIEQSLINDSSDSSEKRVFIQTTAGMLVLQHMICTVPRYDTRRINKRHAGKQWKRTRILLYNII